MARQKPGILPSFPSPAQYALLIWGATLLSAPIYICEHVGWFTHVISHAFMSGVVWGARCLGIRVRKVCGLAVLGYRREDAGRCERQVWGKHVLLWRRCVLCRSGGSVRGQRGAMCLGRAVGVK